MAKLVYMDSGRSPYDETLALQQRLVTQVRTSEEELAYLVLVQHDPPVITLGRDTDKRNVVASPDELAGMGIEVRPTTRGGDVTYHGPGQLVGYPILRIDRHGRDVHRYLRDLEEVLIRLLGRFGIDGGRREDLTGVWAAGGKVAAIGIAVRRWVSYHGFALNVCPDLSHFRTIVPCGLWGESVTSMSAELGRDVSVGDLAPALIECMVDVFGFDGASAVAVQGAHDAGE